MGPTVVLDQQLSERVRGLLAEQTVGSDDAEPSAVVQNLQAPFDEQTVEVHVASHRGEPRLTVVGEAA